MDNTQKSLREDYIEKMNLISDMITDIVGDGNHDVFPEPIEKQLLGLSNTVSDIIVDMSVSVMIHGDIETLKEVVYELSKFGYDMTMVIDKVKEVFNCTNKKESDT